jgi:hypothetical protein
VEIDYHFFRENVQQKTLDVRFISNKDQLANGVTKPIVSARFAFLRDKLNVYLFSLTLEGHIMEKHSADHGKCNCTLIPRVNYLLSMYIP